MPAASCWSCSRPVPPAHATNSAGETFQPYYFQMREALLNERARGEREACVFTG